MKKTLTLALFTTLFAAQAFGAYIVVLKNGTQYAAKAKPSVVNGKAIIQLENGQSMSVDPSLIDGPRSEQATKYGMSNASVIDLNTNTAPAPAAPKQQSLGDAIRLRPRPQEKAPAQTAPAPKQQPAPVAPPPVTTAPGRLGQDVIDKFERAFDNIGIFERKLEATGGRSLRVDMTVDTEDRVFNAISATAYLMVRNAGMTGVQIDMVELYMKTTVNGAAGRFQMTRQDAEALTSNKISQQEYFVRNVIY